MSTAIAMQYANEQTAISKQQMGKHVPTAIGLLLETMFSIWFVQSGCKENSWSNHGKLRVGSSVELCKGG
jgi:hypothetical protein